MPPTTPGVTPNDSIFKEIVALPAEIQCLVFGFHACMYRTGYEEPNDNEYDTEAKYDAAKMEPGYGLLVLGYQCPGVRHLTNIPYTFLVSSATYFTNYPHLYKIYLVEALKNIVFDFGGSSCSLAMFGKRLMNYFPAKQLPGGIRIKFDMFPTRWSLPAHRPWIIKNAFEGMDHWQETSMAHGYEEHAWEHVLEWMEALQVLSTNINPHAVKEDHQFGIRTHLIMHRPWRDYRRLKGASAPLRMNRGKVNIEWTWTAAEHYNDEIPRLDLHLDLTADALQGTSKALHHKISDEEAKVWVAHGSRGFRG